MFSNSYSLVVRQRVSNDGESGGKNDSVHYDECFRPTAILHSESHHALDTYCNLAITTERKTVICKADSSIIIIIEIIIAPLTIVSEDQWGDLECLYKACQAARTNGGLFTETGVRR